MESLVVNLLRIASFVFIARALLSWFPIRPDSGLYPIAQGIHRATEPVLAPIRNVLPRMGGIDFSVFIAIIGINVILIPIAIAIVP
jgi:YggT family protein